MAELELRFSREHRSVTRINYTYIPDRAILPRARASVPSVLRLTGERIYTKRRLPENSRFGPVCGVRRDINWNLANLLLITSPKHRPVFILPDIKKQTAVHIDVSDENTSNWLHYTRRATSGQETLHLQRCGAELYLVTTRPLPPGTELTIADYTFQDEINFKSEYPNADSLICCKCSDIFDTLEEQRMHVCQDIRCKTDVSAQIRPTLQSCPENLNPAESTVISKEILADLKNRPPRRSPEDETRVESSKTMVERNVDQITGALAKVVLESKKRDSKKRLICIICKFAAKSREEYRRHIKNHSQDDGLYHCHRCVTTHKSYSRLQKHFTAKHCGKNHVCPQCQRAFTRRSAREAHMLTHTDVRQFVCECGRAFKHKHKLVEHVRKCQNIKKTSKQSNGLNSSFICLLCSNGFKRRGMLVNHMSREHGGRAEVGPPPDLPARDYFCPYCARVYRTKAKRNSHALKHHPGEPVPKDNGVEAERPPVPGKVSRCPHTQCGREYTSRSRLNRHVAERHLASVKPSTRNDYNQARSDRHCDQNTSISVQSLGTAAHTPSNMLTHTPAATEVFTSGQSVFSVTDPPMTNVPSQLPIQTSSSAPPVSDVTPEPMYEAVPPGTTILFLPADQHAELFGSQMAEGVTLSLEVVGECEEYNQQMHCPQYI